jgi:hypothetical protein
LARTARWSKLAGEQYETPRQLAAHLEGGFSHAAARRAIEVRLANAALEKERRRGRRSSAECPVYVLGEEVAQEIHSLPELKQPNVDWYWAIYFGLYEDKVSELANTIAFKGELSVAKEVSRVASILHISAIVRDVFEYVEQGGRRD